MLKIKQLMLLLALDGSRLRVTVVCSNVVAIGTQNRTESVIHEIQILDAAKQFFALCFEALVIRLVALDTSKQQLVHLLDCILCGPPSPASPTGETGARGRGTSPSSSASASDEVL